MRTHICLCPCEFSHSEPLCIHTYTHKYTYIKNHIKDTLVYRPVLCTLRLACALANAQTLNLFVYMHMLTSIYIYIISQILLYMNPFCANSHICLCPCKCPHFEALCIHAYTHKHTYVISEILLYINQFCANSQMVVPFRVLTLRTSLYT